MDTKNKSVTKRELCFIGKHIARSHVIVQHVAKLFKHWVQLLVSFEDVKISTDCLAECLKVLAACFETNARLSFLIIRKH